MKKVIVYYTDSRLEEELDNTVRKQILKASDGMPITSVSQKPINSEDYQFGYNIIVGFKPSCYLSLYEQLLTGLKTVEKDSIVYLCEHDVFYHQSHFDFIPPRKEKIYYNLNRYYWARNVNYFVRAIGKRALSQCVSYIDPLLSHAKEQVSARLNGGASPCIGPFLNFESKYPNVDIRHAGNFSQSNRFDTSDRDYIIDGWGTPRMFQQEVGYKNQDIYTSIYLERIFNPEKKPHPIIVGKFYRNVLPGLFHSIGYKNGAEIGVKLGVFSKQVCEGMPDVNLKCVDPYNPGPGVGWDESEVRFIAAKQALKNFNTKIIKKTSLQAADEDVPKSSLDFVYIDADHSFNNVMQDIIVWSDRVRLGGIVSGHDYDNIEVKTAVDAYVGVHNQDLYVTDMGSKYPDSSPSWFFAKKGSA